MRGSCIRHPAKEPVIVVRRWQLEATGGHKAAAALLSFFEYWHNVKLEQARKAREANDVAERHQDGRPHAEDLIQHHNEQQLRDGVMLFGKNSINEGIKVLEDLEFVEVVPNPNPRYSFDKTRHFVFKDEVVNEWLNRRSEGPKSDDRSADKGSRSSRTGSRSAGLGSTSPDTSSDTSSDITDAAGTDDQPESDDDALTADDVVGIFVDYLAKVRTVRKTPHDRQRPVPKSGTRSKGSLSRHIKRELEDGRNPEVVEKAVRRIALRWDGYPMELAEAIGDVLDDKPWTIEQEQARTSRRRDKTTETPISGEEGAARRREGYEDLFDGETRGRRRPKPKEEPDPWESSAFGDIVPHEEWGRPASPSTAAAIKARLLDLAVSDGEAGETYTAAVVELRASAWVGEPFKKRVIAEAELIREQNGQEAS